MFNIPQQVKIFVSLEPTDMRRGFNGLSGQVLRAELWSHFWPNFDCRELVLF